MLFRGADTAQASPESLGPHGLRPATTQPLQHQHPPAPALPGDKRPGCVWLPECPFCAQVCRASWELELPAGVVSARADPVPSVAGPALPRQSLSTTLLLVPLCQRCPPAGQLPTASLRGSACLPSLSFPQGVFPALAPSPPLPAPWPGLADPWGSSLLWRCGARGEGRPPCQPASRAPLTPPARAAPALRAAGPVGSFQVQLWCSRSAAFRLGLQLRLLIRLKRANEWFSDKVDPSSRGSVCTEKTGASILGFVGCFGIPGKGSAPPPPWCPLRRYSFPERDSAGLVGQMLIFLLRRRLFLVPLCRKTRSVHLRAANLRSQRRLRPGEAQDGAPRMGRSLLPDSEAP